MGKTRGWTQDHTGAPAIPKRFNCSRKRLVSTSNFDFIVSFLNTCIDCYKPALRKLPTVSTVTSFCNFWEKKYEDLMKVTAKSSQKIQNCFISNKNYTIIHFKVVNIYIHANKWLHIFFYTKLDTCISVFDFCTILNVFMYVNKCSLHFHPQVYTTTSPRLYWRIGKQCTGDQIMQGKFVTSELLKWQGFIGSND